MSALLAQRIAEVNQALDGYLPADCYPEEIYAAMRYSVFAGGKRLRPLLCLAAAEAAGLDYKRALPLACSLELIHTYSLIHDDLPALDNDDLRRGKPTSHRVYGEDMAILAGDALLTFAFEILASLGDDSKVSLSAVVKIIKEVAVAAGVKGMVGGQVVDVASQGKNVTLDTLNYIHQNKTGALIRVSVRSGCLLAGGGDTFLLGLSEYADKLGLAFQIIDDYLDETGNEKTLGKKVGSDQGLQKATYTSLLGQEASLREADKLYKEALACLEPMGKRAEVLKHLASKLVYRDR